ncbi:helix-turn-helix transcriptional regulator [Chitinilyticum piscinae]|uniref:AlpA family transcriptional regulator n=1 Tax=Chitinilyticum piscinae TaxID=2866724 RepID=A0A8J7FP13_9NEIS|nr:AlpA family phage regulatory protein [Chitinilyticum piscinae]MBE9607866.1 AlpA family transcriptional regulator [Chitinilyticum piscinae]
MQENPHGLQRQTLAPASHRILRMKDVTAITGISKSSIYRHIQSGHFPQSIRLSQHAVGWRSDQIEAWMNSLPRNTQ